MEVIVAFSLKDLEGKDGSKEDEKIVAESTLDKVKRGGIVTAAALTGGTVMAATGGMVIYIIRYTIHFSLLIRS